MKKNIYLLKIQNLNKLNHISFITSIQYKNYIKKYNLIYYTENDDEEINIIKIYNLIIDNNKYELINIKINKLYKTID